MLTPAILIQAYGCKVAVAEKWAPHICSAAKLCDADHDNNRLACFLAQLGHESGRLRYVREIWGPTAQQLRYDGTHLATMLGNTQPGDGKLFMGRGLIQITGRVNYRGIKPKLEALLQNESVAKHDLPDVPDFEAEPQQLERPLWAAMSAGLYWSDRKLNRFADNHDFVTLTKRINGGINGLADRQAIFSSAFTALLQAS